MELKLFRRIHKKDYVFITCKRISQASCKLASRRNKKKGNKQAEEHYSKRSFNIHKKELLKSD